jgi:hypothetical protein
MKNLSNLRKVNKPCKKKGRNPKKILSEMSDEIVRYSTLRDVEWDFEEFHGNRDMWDDETCKEHDELLEEIQASRSRLTELVREATGDYMANV